MGLYKESNFLRGLKKMSLMQQYGPAKEKESFKREKKNKIDVSLQLYQYYFS